MVNSRNIRELFIQILQKANKVLGNNQSLKSLAGDINSLDTYIVENYQAIIDLPMYSKSAVLKIFNNNKNLKTLVYRYGTLLQYNMQTEAEKELSRLKDFVNQTLNKYSLKHQSENIDINSNIKEIISFLQPHIALVGEAQAVKDLQRGLSLLNKNRKQSPIETKNILLQDGIYGNKTQACLCDVCKNYTPRVIKKYIKKGIQNNVIFDTKNNFSIDTEKLMDGLCANIERKM